MNCFNTRRRARPAARIFLALLTFAAPQLAANSALAQQRPAEPARTAPPARPDATAATPPAASLAQSLTSPAQPQASPAQSLAAPDPRQQAPFFRLERTPVAGGAELLTIFGNQDGLPTSQSQTGRAGQGDDQKVRPGDDAQQIPLVTVLRDTLGDESAENDLLRYVWMHTYTRPSARQRAASAVPFLYARVGGKGRAGGDVPPHVLDLSAAERDVWKRVFWSSLQMLLVDPVSLSVKASSRAYRRNVEDYRRAHVLRALAVLALYEADSGSPSVFTAEEMKEIQARLALTQKTFGGLIDDLYLGRVQQRQDSQWRDTRGHNWEMLRQRAEAEGLYFEPLTMPGGDATHALLWTTREDVAANRARKFDKRFLNIDNPWTDARLRKWDGYTETRRFDADGRRVEEKTEDATGAADAQTEAQANEQGSGARAASQGSHTREMIPLALYGLDHPRIPVLLVDFRDTLNPKGREVSRRVLKDVTSTLFTFSRFDLAYTLGRAVYDWTTDKRGMDINQPSRLRAYTQLKLLLSLDASLDPTLRDEVSRRLEHVSLNPLENGGAAEARLAREQYAALLDYARRPDGLAARLSRDRREELVPARHGRTGRLAFKLANTLTFGLYTHRESATPDEQRAALDSSRTLAHHRRFLREVAKSSSRVEVEWDLNEVRRSLRYIAEYGERAGGRAASAVALIYARTADEETRALCLSGLYRINNETAKNSLVRIYNDETQDARWRTLSAQYLRRAAREEQRISQTDAKIIANISGYE